MEINKEEYKEALETKIEDKKWAEKFLKSKDWKKLAGYISDAYPIDSPYGMDTLLEIKAQGAYIKGLTFPESLLLSIMREGDDALAELQTNPDAN